MKCCRLGFAPVLASELSTRHQHLFISEGFTAGFLFWTLAGAGVPLSGGRLTGQWPQIEPREIFPNPQGAEMVIQVGVLLPDDSVVLSLHSAELCWQYQVKFISSASRQDLAVRQEMIALLAMRMLQRVLQQKPLTLEHAGLILLNSHVQPR